MHRLKRVRHFALDLDGTLYLGGKLFDFTPPFLKTLDDLKLGRTFMTNNSSRSTSMYVEHLRAMGIEADATDICTSTDATVAFLKRDLPQVRRLFVLGTLPLQREFVEHGFSLHGDDPRDEPEAVIVGFDMTLTYSRLCSAAWWINRGMPYLATHPDRVCPTDGPTILPDCGAICALLASATGRQPDAILGKPDARMLRPVLERNHLQPDELAVVGDRLYTDVELARRSGALGILVFSGETGPDQLQSSSTKPDLTLRDVGELGRLLRSQSLSNS